MFESQLNRTYKMINPKFSLFCIALIGIIRLSLAQPCTVRYTNNAISACQNQPLVLSASSSSGSPAVTWTSTPPGGITAGGTTLTPTINTASLTSYILIVNGNSGQCIDTVYVTVHPTPAVPTFSFSPTLPQCSGTPISFSVSNAQAGTTYSWNFGDGGNATGTSASHSYNAIGGSTASFTVVLTATITATGCASSSSSAIIVNQIPDASIADFSYSAPDKAFSHCGSGAYTLTIDNTSTTVATNTHYDINWGDGSPLASFSSLPTTGTTHIYSAIGYSNISLTVTGQNGCTATKIYPFFNGNNPTVPYSNPGNTIGRCTPYSFTTASYPTTNPPGTIYIAFKNDGTPNDTFYTAPTFYTHIFTTSPCGVSGGTTPNTFYVRIRAQNPCGFSDLTIEPITTIIKPVAKFLISPDSIACVNTLVTFTNKSIPGVAVDNSGVCDSANKKNWSISPSSGWSISSGSLGTIPPNNNPATWGSNNIGVSFTTPGTFTVTLRVYANDTCGVDSVIHRVCIQSPPVASLTAPSHTGCAPYSQTYTSTSTGISQCGTITRTWVVSKISSTCPMDSLIDAVFISGTDQFSLNPVIRFNNEGIYTIKLVLHSGCPDVNSPADTIVIRRKPTVAVGASPSQVCLGNSITATATVTACGDPVTQYNWVFNGGIPSTSTAQTPSPVTYAAAGPKIITLTVQNGCGSTIGTANLQVDTPTVAHAGHDTTVCITSPSIQFTASPTGGAWSGTNVSLSGVFSPSQAGTFILKYTVGTGNCAGIDSITVIVNPATNLLVSPSTSICTGDSAILTASGALSYTWSPPAGLNTTTGPTVISRPAQNTTYTVTGTDLSGCPATVSTTVTVNSTASANAGPDLTLCNQPIPVNLGGSPAGGAWTDIHGVGIPSVYTPSSVRTDTVIYSISGSCPASDTMIIHVVNPSIADAGPDRSICLNSGGIQLVGSPSGNWSGAFITSTGVFTPSQAGLFMIICTTGSGTCLSADTAFVTVIALPSIAVSPASPAYCDGQSVSLTALGASSYSWSPATGLNTTTGPIVTASPASTTTYTVTGTDVTTGCVAMTSATITVSPLPHIINTDTLQTICSDDSLGITLQSDVSGTLFTWSATVNSSLSPYTLSGTSSSIIAPHLHNSSTVSQTLIYTVTPSAGSCIGGVQSFTVIVAPRPIITAIPDTQNICSGASGPVNISSSIAGANIVWTGVATDVSGGNLSGSGSTIPAQALYNTSTQSATGSLVYTISSTGACPGNTVTAVTFVSPRVQTGFVMNILNGCSPLQVLFETEAFTHGPVDSLVFHWADGTADFVLHPNQFAPIWPIVPHTFTNNTSGLLRFIVSLTAKSSCGDTTILDTLTVMPNGTNAFMSGPSGGCAPFDTVLEDHSSGASFSFWVIDPDTINHTAIDTIPSLPGSNLNYTFSAGIHLIALHAIGCSESVVYRTITVYPSPAPEFIYHATQCAGSSSQFSQQCTIATGGTILGYDWTMGDGSVLSGSTVTHIYPVPGIDTVCLLATSAAGCSASICHEVSVVATPHTDFMVHDACLNKQPIQFTDSSVNTNVRQWSFGDGNTSSLTNPTNVFSAPGTYIVTLLGFNGTCTDTITHQVTIFPVPVPRFGVSDTDICRSPAQILFTDSSSGALSYLWNFGNGYTATNLNPIASYSYPGRYDVTLTVTSLNGCTDSLTKQIGINARPSIQSVDIGPTPGCVPFTDTITVTATNALWIHYDFGDQTAALDDTVLSVIHTFTTPGTYTVTVIAYSRPQCSDTLIKTNAVTAYNVPHAGFYMTGDTSHDRILFIDTSTGAIRYHWSFDDGFSSILRDSILHRFEKSGEHSITLYVYSKHCTDSVTHEINVTNICNDHLIAIPNTFTPNHDGLNDVFMIRQPGGSDLAINYFRIYDRWGGLLFQVEDGHPNNIEWGWAGTSTSGEEIPVGVYVYVYEIGCPTGSPIKGRGTVTLQR